MTEFVILTAAIVFAVLILTHLRIAGAILLVIFWLLVGAALVLWWSGPGHFTGCPAGQDTWEGCGDRRAQDRWLKAHPDWWHYHWDGREEVRISEPAE